MLTFKEFSDQLYEAPPTIYSSRKAKRLQFQGDSFELAAILARMGEFYVQIGHRKIIFTDGQDIIVDWLYGLNTLEIQAHQDRLDGFVTALQKQSAAFYSNREPQRSRQKYKIVPIRK